MRRALPALIAAVLAVGANVRDAAAVDRSLVLTPVASGFDRPVSLATAPGDSSRIFITEQSGRVRIVKDGSRIPQPFLDLSDKISCCGERGLLSIAFHPLYQVNGQFYANYTDSNGNTVVSRFTVSATNPDVADETSETAILNVSQPFANHNGGQLQFGPDGYLYIGMGDGGSGGDPGNRAQSPFDLLGKMLRIDVDHRPGYSIPPTNPVIGGKRSEIWALGLRNPWRFSFDMTTGDLFIADVGQNQWEEVNHQPASSTGGENYGWRLMEGTHCYNPPSGCDTGTLVKPIIEYSHLQGCSVTGGYVHRGKSSGLHGTYIFADFCNGIVRGATRTAGGGWTSRELIDAGVFISSLGQDNAGEVYVIDYSGLVFRIDDTQVRRRPVRRPR